MPLLPAAEVAVQLRQRDLVWCYFKLFTRFPVVLWLLLPVAGGPLFNRLTSLGVYYSVVLATFITLYMPWLMARDAYKKYYAGSSVRHIFSESGISSSYRAVSVFVEWKVVSGAIENGQFLLVFLKNGFVLLPKAQLGANGLEGVRALLRSHLKEKARLSV
jgi:hypothetical protein